jgi:hypothetical protein
MTIEQLLNKFYEGATTQEEERYLTDFFLNEENFDERWKEERQLFQYLSNTRIEVSEEISSQLEKTISQMEPSNQQPLRKKWYYQLSAAAAIALLCIGLYFFTIHESSQPQLVDTFSNPEEAAIVAEQTLAYISEKMNKGMEKMNDAEQEFDKLIQIINKYLN